MEPQTKLLIFFIKSEEAEKDPFQTKSYKLNGAG